MFVKYVAKTSKIIGALTAVALGAWAYTHEVSRPHTTDAVTNARLHEIYAPADGKFIQLTHEGSLVLLGEAMAQTTSFETSTVSFSKDIDTTDSFDIASVVSNFPYAFDAVDDSVSTFMKNERAIDFTSNSHPSVTSTAGIIKSNVNETYLISETSGMIWNWRQSSGTHLNSGDSVGYVAECENLIAIGQISMQQKMHIQVGDPVIFTAASTVRTGIVQQIIGGVPNLIGLYAIQFPVIATDNALIFFSLDPTDADQTDCDLGVSGQIHYPLNSRKTPQEIGYLLKGAIDVTVAQATNFYNVIAQRVNEGF